MAKWPSINVLLYPFAALAPEPICHQSRPLFPPLVQKDVYVFLFLSRVMYSQYQISTT